MRKVYFIVHIDESDQIFWHSYGDIDTAEITGRNLAMLMPKTIVMLIGELE